MLRFNPFGQAGALDQRCGSAAALCTLGRAAPAKSPALAETFAARGSAAIDLRTRGVTVFSKTSLGRKQPASATPLP
jgi:hypothetical protein